MHSPTLPRWTGIVVFQWLPGLVVCLLASGCITAPYRYGSNTRYHTSEQLASITQSQIERGQRRPVIDGIGWVVGIPDKIVLWNRRIENHNISVETEQAIAQYLARNELTTVKVRLNQYAPGSDWQRLVANKSVGWGWRYTLGTASWLGETLLPGRLVGGDHYNPFTNTVHIYSDLPAIAIHEGGHAKDFARRYYKGTYAAGYLLPVTPLWYEAVATNDALSYLRAEGTVEDEQAADRLLYPAYGTYVGNSVSTFVPALGTPFYLAGVLGGHIAGRVQASRLRESRQDSVQQANFEVPASPDAELPPEPDTVPRSSPVRQQ
ncbi:MAG: hypothetical protein JSS49_24595 [Planctomycetes bacterium]|nr:hypothetical protein [Planctomycetota bacterium]